MPTPILMPALSPTMEKGKLAKWLKREGDSIKAGDVIAEIETDKATMEVEAVDEGKLGKIMVPEGTEDVAVNTPIAMIVGEGEREEQGTPAPAAAKPAPAPTPPAAPAPAPAAATPPPKPVASGNGAAPTSGGRVFASPLAKRLAKEAGVDIAGLKGSGPHGRIVKADVLAQKDTAPKAQAAAPVASAGAKPPAITDAVIAKMYEPGSYDAVPHDGMRKTIASRLQEAKQTIPHFYLTVDCVLDDLLSAREKLNALAPAGPDKQPAWKLSVNDLIIKALAMALRRVPDANVTWTEGAMLRHKTVDVGVAVAIEGGLFTPVIRNADTKPLSQISLEMKDLADRARKRRLAPHEYQGGTSAVSNLGMFGVKQFDAVINPPHATILAVGAGEQRPVVVNGAVTVKTVMSATLSCDHRAVDGAVGARLLQAFKQFIEQPVLMLA
ncbi:MAG: pyruvate dehydrogenase complex dihydrolipoamide acetyltransferase [Hyphomicrobiales bacterium]